MLMKNSTKLVLGYCWCLLSLAREGLVTAIQFFWKQGKGTSKQAIVYGLFLSAANQNSKSK